MGKPIDNTTCHCLKMRRSAGNVVAFYDRMLEPAGITVRQYSLLYEIWRHKECSVSILAKATELDRSTLTRSLKPLLKRGLVTDLKEPGARNSKLVLTEEGKQVSKQAAVLWMKAQAAFEEKLGADGVKALEDALLVLQDL